MLLVFDRPVENLAEALLYGSRYDSIPVVRVTYTIVETDISTRIVASMAVITNPGSAFERVTPMDGNEESLKVQQFLNELKTSLEEPPSGQQ